MSVEQRSSWAVENILESSRIGRWRRTTRAQSRQWLLSGQCLEHELDTGGMVAQLGKSWVTSVNAARMVAIHHSDVRTTKVRAARVLVDNERRIFVCANKHIRIKCTQLKLATVRPKRIEFIIILLGGVQLQMLRRNCYECFCRNCVLNGAHRLFGVWLWLLIEYTELRSYCLYGKWMK